MCIRDSINNVQGLQQKLSELSNGLPWIERLDMINLPAPLAPELAFKENQSEKEGAKRNAQIKSRKGTDFLPFVTYVFPRYIHLISSSSGNALAEDPVHNDFKREMLFYRQAQSAVLTALPRIKACLLYTSPSPRD